MGQKAPAQRLRDFVDGRLSANLPACSYLPGLISSPLHFVCPILFRAVYAKDLRNSTEKCADFSQTKRLLSALKRAHRQPFAFRATKKQGNIQACKDFFRAAKVQDIRAE